MRKQCVPGASRFSRAPGTRLIYHKLPHPCTLLGVKAWGGLFTQIILEYIPLVQCRVNTRNHQLCSQTTMCPDLKLNFNQKLHLVRKISLKMLTDHARAFTITTVNFRCVKSSVVLSQLMTRQQPTSHQLYIQCTCRYFFDVVNTLYQSSVYLQLEITVVLRDNIGT